MKQRFSNETQLSIILQYIWLILPLNSFELTSTSFSDFDGSISFDGSFFSTPKTTPSFVLTPIAVEPNFNQVLVRHHYNFS
jgi:hypothetical protein